MMTNTERIREQREEKRRRQNVLNKIKYMKLKTEKNRRVKTFSIVQYVIGRYNPNNNTYQYKGTRGWVERLDDAITESNPNNFKVPKNPKGCKYSISKVFVRIVSLYRVDCPEKAHNHVDKITLTNPNHYEMLSAVINNI